MTTIRILGCGSSAGVPMIGCYCKVCTSQELRNNRTRSSIYISYKNTDILIDTSPDFRSQALRNGIKAVDALIYTHAHVDHTAGIDEMRSFNYLQNSTIPVYIEDSNYDEIVKRYSYAFSEIKDSTRGWYKPWLIPSRISSYSKIKIKDLELTFFEQNHGDINSIGIRHENFAYSTDFVYLNDQSLEILQNLDLWIIDCLKYKTSYSHLNYEGAMRYIELVKPKRAILTHMGHELCYNELKNKLPNYIEPAYDGMVIKL